MTQPAQDREATRERRIQAAEARGDHALAQTLRCLQAQRRRSHPWPFMAAPQHR